MNSEFRLTVTLNEVGGELLLAIGGTHAMSGFRVI
jgi:hypothetical protein